MKSLSIYLGRFNPFHRGHAVVLEKALKSSKTVLIIVGSAFRARTVKNPFTFEERREMIARWCSAHGYSNYLVVPLEDSESDAKWIADVQELVHSTQDICSKQNSSFGNDVTIVGSDRDSSTWYLHAFPQFALDLSAEVSLTAGEVNATSVRKIIFERRVGESIDTPFLLSELRVKLPLETVEVIRTLDQSVLDSLREEYAYYEEYKRAWRGPYAPVFVTADAVVIQSGHVLLIERAQLPGKGLLAIPGGFVKSHQRIEDAAVDEVIEETGISLTTGKRALEVTKQMLHGSIQAQKVFDAPGRSLRGRTITHAFLFRLNDLKPLPIVAGQNVPLEETGGVEVVETTSAQWVPIAEALRQKERFFEDHYDILLHFVNTSR